MSIYADLQPISGSSGCSSILSFIRLHFPINELTAVQWSTLEKVVDFRESPPISTTTTFRLCERVEWCSENHLHLLVTRYLQIDPVVRKIVLKKTVKQIPTIFPVEMYLKDHSAVRKM